MQRWDDGPGSDQEEQSMVDKEKNFYGAASLIPSGLGIAGLTPTGNMIPAAEYTPPNLDVGEYSETLKFPEMEFSIEKITEAAKKKAIGPDGGVYEIRTPKYRYSEGKNMQEFVDYVNSTYGAHYTSKNEIQALDVFEALGSLFTTSRDLAIKYLWRCKKKGTKEDARKDLLKVMHYTLFMLHALEQDDK